jgi:hypothetical protein
MMKSFKEYLVENKKVYSFKVKVAGDLPEKFQESLKSRLDRCKVATLEKISTTPIQKVPLDFPGHENMEVSIFEVVCEYPITAPEIAEDLKQIGIDEDCFRVRGSSEPSEIDQLGLGEEQKIASQSDKVKHKDYFGADFNKGFLKDLEKTNKARKKEQGQGEYKLPKAKEDKTGAKSALGS